MMKNKNKGKTEITYWLCLILVLFVFLCQSCDEEIKEKQQSESKIRINKSSGTQSGSQRRIAMLIAVFEEQEPLHKIESPSGNPADRQSPDAFETEVAAQLAAFKPIGGEIEVTPSALKLGTPLLVRRSSDPVPGPPADTQPSASHPGGQSLKLVVPDSTQNLEDREVLNGVQTELLTSPRTKDTLSDMTRTVEISGEGGPLGIHVVPFFSSLSGRILGLFIRGIEDNSRSKREGLFHENECIVKINNVDLVDKTFAQAQDVFRQAMKSPSVLLHVLPPQNREQYEKSVIGSLNIFGNNDGVLKTKVPPPVHGKSGLKTANLTGTDSPETDASASLQQNKSPRVPRLGGKPSSPSLSPLMGFGSNKNAKKIKIDLKKGPEGLGFTVVTRDSSIHGPGPIFVKNILPKGAAIKDGRLQSGDRILEVNGRDVTGRTQEELVAMLRSTKQGETASLVIARQEGHFLPRELKGEPDCCALSLETSEQLTFEIPLNDSGSAGLGVSLKGNKSRETGTDLGIFIKSIIHGGAAFKDGRLRMNDQLIAVNGESLLGKSNHEAMETLRRSMSMEGNIRGMIQLVILRRPERPMEDPAECGAFSKPCFENCQNAVTTSRRNDNSILHPLGTCSPQDKQKGLLLPNDGWAESEVPPSPTPHSALGLGLEDYSHSSGVDSAVYFPDQHINFRSVTPARQPESINLKASKSMDLVPDESKVHSLAGQKSESPSKDFGPTLGLKKSSSLESLQTAVAEVRKNDLPFHRPRPHMVRGRGCNESFRAAIDKSYDGPEEIEADGLSDKSSHSGQGALNCESAPQGNSELEDMENKARKVKKTKEKEKKKEKGKLKVKEKKRKEENEDPERKIKKKGFGAMLRFGKKKEDKGGKAEQKGTLKHGGLREEELEKMKEERERIGAKHQELREKQARGLLDYATGAIGSVYDMDDDEMDPNYARVNHFREPCTSANVFRSPSPPRAGPFGYPRDGHPLSPERDHLEGLYAKVNKPYHPLVPADSGRPTGGSTDRIQKLRKEYYQARREGFPLYEDDEGRARPSEYDLLWVPGRGPDGNAHNLRFEGMERQYASLPRGGPADPVDYLPAAPRGLYKERELPYYPGAHPMHPPKGSYPRPTELRVADLRYPQHYPPPPAPQHKGPFRQDVPPSPPQHQRMPAYQETGRPGPRGGSPDQYPYRTQDSRQKNPMTAAV
ncbi:partitioning defective 3 homolog B isoform X2 [Homo sapiens]|uniref:partitioning defective 3 homolog B isoform X2 n=1 Tax=Homo sapiens TaxID=9606 RepID=UPI0007DC7E23|nr:partitioning defective 3 homolog B isoform X2 [Homo sapiens]|eukprot:XP_016858772.1 partitioning defective 3 homolog B isoform X2 [Homo sapiens]